MHLSNWDSPDSESKKEELIGMKWGSEINSCLWYCLGDTEMLYPKNLDAIKAECFVEQNVNSGKIEIHKSSMLPNNQIVLKLGGNLILKPSLTINGQYCPLYQVEYGEGSNRINFYEK